MIGTTQEPGVMSDVALVDNVMRLSNAGAALIQVRTREVPRAAVALRKHFVTMNGAHYLEWDIVNGWRLFTAETYNNHLTEGDKMFDIRSAFLRPITELRNPTSEVNTRNDDMFYYVYVDPHPYVANNPNVAAVIQQLSAILPSTNVCVIAITPDVALGELPLGTVMVADMPTPSAEELEVSLVSIIDSAKNDFPEGCVLTDAESASLACLGLGLTVSEFEMYSALAIIEAGEAGSPAITYKHLSDGISLGKVEVVKQSDILELYHPEPIENLGGMDNLKSWLAARASCFSEEAHEFGIKAPKGCTLVGVPGTGKSLAAKTTASVLGIPLVRLDFGKVFSKFVGDSESRVRSALKMVESMAPVVLFVDEIDKGLGGIGGGGGDSGTSMRVLGSFLTWLQDNDKPVFTMVTANSIEGLPPELLRRGRFDAIFSVVLPSPHERKEVLAIHLRKCGYAEDYFTESELVEFVKASENYVPSEIEASLQDALIAAFSEKTDLDVRHLVSALRGMVPMSRSHKDRIDSIIDWARNNATPVSSPAEERQAVATQSRRPVSRTPISKKMH